MTGSASLQLPWPYGEPIGSVEAAARRPFAGESACLGAVGGGIVVPWTHPAAMDSRPARVAAIAATGPEAAQ